MNEAIQGMELKAAGLKWWRFSQNNSGGYFIKDEMVAEEVFVQAANAAQAMEKAEALFDDKSEYCECCGTRWSDEVKEEDGFDVPMRYGKPLQQVAVWNKDEARLHFADGRVVAFVFPVRSSGL